MTMGQRVLTLVGDPNQINTWSNIPYYFLQAGRSLNFIQAGLPLQPEKLRWQRILWNLSTWLKTGERGGFQYSPACLRPLFAQSAVPAGQVEWISHFPLLPPRPWLSSWRVNYYIDATLHQNFVDYGIGRIVSMPVQRAALAQEQENYRQAERIVCMSRWAANSVVQDYGIAAAKVHVVPAGANLDEDLLSTIDLTASDRAVSPLRLGFIGKDWRRKGLPFVLQVADELQKQQIDVEVVVAGPNPSDLPSHPALKPVGFIDKGKDIGRFVALVRSLHFGCLFSTAEAFGISNRECLRLGVPVIGFSSGGIPDTVPPGLGYLFAPETPPLEVAAALMPFVRTPAKYDALRQRVIARSPEFTWRHTVEQMMSLWQETADFIHELA